MDIATRLVVGLGNPGRDYEHTRHNIGFEAIDALAERHKIALNKRDHKALSGDGLVGDTRVYLMKPLTFMNLSGQSVASFLRQRTIDPSQILVIVDDIALPLGKLRLRPSGSAGGHNGLKSIISNLGSDSFPRLRLGVGQPPRPDVQIDYVLGKFSKSEQKVVDETITSAIVACELWLERPIDQAMNVVNTMQA